MKQDIQDTRAEFAQSLAVLHASMDGKFQNLNSQLISSMTLQKTWKILSMTACQKSKMQLLKH